MGKLGFSNGVRKKLLNDKSLEVNVAILRKKHVILPKVTNEPESEQKICKLTVQCSVHT